MGYLLWVQRATYCVDIKIELYKIFAIINRVIKGLHCITPSLNDHVDYQSSRMDFTLRLPIGRRKHQMIIILTNPTSTNPTNFTSDMADVISWRLDNIIIIIIIIIIIMGRMGICFTSVVTSWWGEACCLLLCFPTGTCVFRCTYSAVFEFWLFGGVFKITLLLIDMTGTHFKCQYCLSITPSINTA